MTMVKISTCVQHHLYHQAAELSEVWPGHVAQYVALILHHRSE